ncbi:acetyl-CoA synthetase [Planomonospora venezuelensis]|uniref:Acetyl-CoA C-acetyltransferase n=1 Tax=Planomonospora venezuelensis TaxID=1999 RepID=A0A841DBU0_PLAVE|nr:acetyl-CoA synthetase [Planomonospora venezuelensis]MBB5966283.1 acetyl-CoA C-acetyltransferase [Planomonospora venezuelensis]
MSPDPRTPCLVGVAQHTVRDLPAPEPLDLWELAAREAAADAGAPGLLERLDSIQVVYTESWQYDDPVARLAERLKADPRHRVYSTVSGTAPQTLLGTAAAAIAAGEMDAALVAGAEAFATRRALRRAGERPAWSHPAHPRPPYGWERPPHPAELAHELFLPVHTYPIMETARRAAAGESIEEEFRGRGRMMAPMTRVAAANPHAWERVVRTPEELVTPSAQNRFVGWPYTKRTVALAEVDQAAAVIMVSTGLADRLGIPRDRRVHLRGWAYAEDTWEVAARPVMGASPAMAAAARHAFARAGVGADDLGALDLYSCFAVALRAACAATGIDPLDPRGLTVTGGLPYAGAPVSVYVLHSTAAMARRLRAEPGPGPVHGLVTGVGMHLTKHTYAVWSTEPGEAFGGGRGGDPGSGAGAGLAGLRGAAVPVHTAEPVPIADTWEGTATVAGYTVAHGRDGAAERGILVVDLPGGARAHACVRDPGLMAEAEAAELVGREVRLVPDGAVNAATW